MDEALLNDIRRALQILFRESKRVPKGTLERIIAFDMEWLAPSESEEMVTRLYDNGWVSKDDDILELVAVIPEVDVPFGWFPKPLHLLHPPVYNVTNDDIQPSPSNHIQTSQHSEPTAVSHSDSSSNQETTRMHQTKRLFSFLSKSSGVDKAELNRRLERKISALEYITPWMALALIAKELGLKMDEIISVFQQ